MPLSVAQGTVIDDVAPARPLALGREPCSVSAGREISRVLTAVIGHGVVGRGGGIPFRPPTPPPTLARWSLPLRVVTSTTASSAPLSFRAASAARWTTAPRSAQRAARSSSSSAVPPAPGWGWLSSRARCEARTTMAFSSVKGRAPPAETSPHRRLDGPGGTGACGTPRRRTAGTATGARREAPGCMIDITLVPRHPVASDARSRFVTESDTRIHETTEDYLCRVTWCLLVRPQILRDAYQAGHLRSSPPRPRSPCSRRPGRGQPPAPRV